MILSEFMHNYTREHATTRKVLHALPPDQSHFKPHDRSNSAHMLGWTFVVEEHMIAKALSGEQVLGGGWPRLRHGQRSSMPSTRVTPRFSTWPRTPTPHR